MEMFQGEHRSGVVAEVRHKEVKELVPGICRHMSSLLDSVFDGPPCHGLAWQHARGSRHGTSPSPSCGVSRSDQYRFY